VNNTSLTTLTSNLNLNVRRPFLELMLKVNGIKIGIAIGLHGLLVAVQRSTSAGSSPSAAGGLTGNGADRDRTRDSTAADFRRFRV
jgi:hypothetical protein